MTITPRPVAGATIRPTIATAVHIYDADRYYDADLPYDTTSPGTITPRP